MDSAVSLVDCYVWVRMWRGGYFCESEDDWTSDPSSQMCSQSFGDVLGVRAALSLLPTRDNHNKRFNGVTKRLLYEHKHGHPNRTHTAQIVRGVIYYASQTGRKLSLQLKRLGGASTHRNVGKKIQVNQRITLSKSKSQNRVEKMRRQ